MIELSSKDLKQLDSKGISKEKVQNQIQTFKEGIPFVELSQAAVVGNGILRFSEKEQLDLIQYFEDNRKNLELLKFVPASGAASRMFKAMFNFLDSYEPSKENLSEYIERTGDTDAKKFTENLSDFPFYDLIMSKIEGKASNKDEEAYLFVKEMLTENGLDYGFYPKGLLPFHKYSSGTATPFEEHLKEAALYAKTKGKANLHFTVSQQHDEMFAKEEASVGPKISKQTDTKFDVSYSNQKPSTDTIAVDMDNKPFKNSDGSILFRPGGHGALIENLNDQDADIVFIKNIDNVVPDRLKKITFDYKKALAGMLLEYQEKLFYFQKELNEKHPVALESSFLAEAVRFLSDTMNITPPEDLYYTEKENLYHYLKEKMNRPLRVCGMVRNEGEPGGGPFLAKNPDGSVSLQVVESSQIDPDSVQQQNIVKNATHFNPVDLMCATRNYKGEKYDLKRFTGPATGFI